MEIYLIDFKEKEILTQTKNTILIVHRKFIFILGEIQRPVIQKGTIIDIQMDMQATSFLHQLERLLWQNKGT